MPTNNPIIGPLKTWIESCKDKGTVSRNTVAVGIVVLDHLRETCPIVPESVVSRRGEIKGARSGLAGTLERYEIRGKYLKEVTTRAGHQDGQRLFEALGYGSCLEGIDDADRDRYLVEAIGMLAGLAREWQGRQQLKIDCDRQQSPAAWVESILLEAKGKSAGKVEQHLVGAKLARRHPDETVPNNPGHAGDAQTGRPGDFLVGSTAYHVTASPGSSVVQKCRANLGAGLHPMLLVPRGEVDRARHIAEDQGVGDRITIVAIEDFIALNIIEMSTGRQERFVSVLKSIIEEYNSRVQEVETDMSLRIDLS